MEHLQTGAAVGGEDTLHFEVDASLLFELGEQLVARNSVALSELIKNAYDADATHVTVTFSDITTVGGTITVKDDGNGMPFAILQKVWMRIATTDKVVNPYSPIYHRARTGAKGVGRFATRKLARQLTVHSVAAIDSSSWESVTLKLDWDLFRPGEDLSKVPAAVTQSVSKSPLATGVTLVLSGVRDAWTEEDIVDVRNDLLDLMAPFPEALVKQDNVDPGFSVKLVVPDYPEYEGEVVDQYLSAAWGKISAVVGDDGTPVYVLKVRTTGREITYRPQGIALREISGATLTVHNMVYKGNTSLEDMNIGIRDARRFGRRFGGVKVYLDSFRVFPYGDPGNDWLSLDEDKANRLSAPNPLTRDYLPADAGRDMLYLPGNNNLFGGIFLSRTRHPGLKPKISREGFLENGAFSQLVLFARLGIDWMTVTRARLNREEAEEEKRRRQEEKAAQRKPSGSQAPEQKPEPPKQTAVEAIQQATAFIQERIKEISERTPVPEEAKEVLARELSQLTQTVQMQESEQITKMAMLRILASAGTTVVIFNHQIRAVLDGLRRLVYDFGEVGSQPDLFLLNDLDSMRERLRTWLRMMEGQATQLGLLLGVEARRKRRKLALKPVVEQVREGFEVYCGNHGIDFTNEVPAFVRTPPLYEAELHSLLLNLVTNALKAVKEQAQRKVEISADDDGKAMVIRVKDTGHGIALEDRERVFEPFETTSAPDPVLGVGTGLGLTLVRDMVTEHSGTVKFIDIPLPWRTCVEIRIPHGVDD